ncbi:MAG: hypothetical protein QXL10_03310 [Candidatus Bathyarchaeia archaeon]
MSELEDPVTTLLRLITTRIWVIKDNGSRASILATKEAYDRELLKECDAQITLALDSSQDQKLELAGRLRRRYMVFRCNIYTVDKTAPGADAGKVMRDKVTAQINAIIRENRNLPYQTVYNFYGLGYPSGEPHKAFSAGAAAELSPQSALWVELTNVQYQNIWSSDDVRFSKSHNVNGEYALMLFRFKIGAREQCVKKIVLSFEGYGTAPGGNGAIIKIWNHVASAWQQAQSGTGGGDETLSITISSNWTDYIDSDGYVWLLARTTNPSNGSTPAVLYCDFAQCTIQVYGITYCDVVSYRHIDVTDVKPYLYRTEFLLKGWLFESISGSF